MYKILIIMLLLGFGCAKEIPVKEAVKPKIIVSDEPIKPKPKPDFFERSYVRKFDSLPRTLNLIVKKPRPAQLLDTYPSQVTFYLYVGDKINENNHLVSFAFPEHKIHYPLIYKVFISKNIRAYKNEEDCLFHITIIS